jgi:hypothetical protein
MSDKDAIIGLLEAAERRIRANRLLHDAATVLRVALLAPVAFKLVDLIWPLRGRTVTGFFILWAVATLIALVWRARGRDTLERTAAHLDRAIDAHDELKTAYWFIQNPRPSGWVEAQLQRAAANVGKIRLETICPRSMPRASYAVAGLLLLLGVLNFLPLPWNHNWFYLQGAPAFSLNAAQDRTLQQALELLKKAEELQQSELAKQLAGIMRALQDGSMTKDQLSRGLADLQKALSEKNFNAGRINDGLERIAKALEPSLLTRPIATKIFRLDLKAAAEEVRKIERTLGAASSSDLDEMAGRFQDGSDAAGKGLEQLAGYMHEAAGAMRTRNISAGQAALEQTAKEFERLQRVLESQRLQSEASQQIAALQDSVGGNPGEVGEGGDAVAANTGNEGQSEGQDADVQSTGQGKGQGEGQGEGMGEGQGEGQDGEGEGQGEGESDQPGRGGGRGGKNAGLSGPFPARGEPTSLETQLDKEVLPVRPARGSRPESIIEHSEKEASKLEYRNLPSKLTPAQKDLLNQDAIPYEQRQFVKDYFEKIRK